MHAGSEEIACMRVRAGREGFKRMAGVGQRWARGACVAPVCRKPRPVPPCPALPCPALPCPAPPCPAPPRPALPRPALPCPALPCPALPRPALPCPAPAPPRPAPPCPALPAAAFTDNIVLLLLLAAGSPVLKPGQAPRRATACGPSHPCPHAHALPIDGHRQDRLSDLRLCQRVRGHLDCQHRPQGAQELAG